MAKKDMTLMYLLGAGLIAAGGYIAYEKFGKKKEEELKKVIPINAGGGAGSTPSAGNTGGSIADAFRKIMDNSKVGSPATPPPAPVSDNPMNAIGGLSNVIGSTVDSAIRSSPIGGIYGALQAREDAQAAEVANTLRRKYASIGNCFDWKKERRMHPGFLGIMMDRELVVAYNKCTGQELEVSIYSHFR